MPKSKTVKDAVKEWLKLVIAEDDIDVSCPARVALKKLERLDRLDKFVGHLVGVDLKYTDAKAVLESIIDEAKTLKDDSVYCTDCGAPIGLDVTGKYVDQINALQKRVRELEADLAQADEGYRTGAIAVADCCEKNAQAEHDARAWAHKEESHRATMELALARIADDGNWVGGEWANPDSIQVVAQDALLTGRERKELRSAKRKVYKDIDSGKATIKPMTADQILGAHGISKEEEIQALKRYEEARNKYIGTKKLSKRTTGRKLTKRK